jgi:hypothetical protein
MKTELKVANKLKVIEEQLYQKIEGEESGLSLLEKTTALSDLANIMTLRIQLERYACGLDTGGVNPLEILEELRSCDGSEALTKGGPQWLAC